MPNGKGNIVVSHQPPAQISRLSHSSPASKAHNTPPDGHGIFLKSSHVRT